MLIPDKRRRNSSPAYIRALLQRAGLTQHGAAERLGVSPRMMRYYVADPGADHRPAPYLVQFALEVLAEAAEKGVDA